MKTRYKSIKLGNAKFGIYTKLRNILKMVGLIVDHPSPKQVTMRDRSRRLKEESESLIEFKTQSGKSVKLDELQIGRCYEVVGLEKAQEPNVSSDNLIRVIDRFGSRPTLAFVHRPAFSQAVGA